MISDKQLKEARDLSEFIEKACNKTSISLSKTMNQPLNLGYTPVLALAIELNKILGWKEFKEEEK